MRVVHSLAFRCPGAPRSLVELLLRALPGRDGEALEQVVRGRFVLVDGRPARNPGRQVEPGERVTLDLDGLPRALAEALGPGEEDAAVRAETAAGATVVAARVLAREPCWPRGLLDGPHGGVRFAVREVRGGVAELALESALPEGLRAADLLSTLADAGSPVLGDTQRGGVLVEGGLRLRVGAAAEPVEDPSAEDAWWPAEPAFAGLSHGEPAVLRVSDATRRVLARGHPFILRDEETSDTSGLPHGALVRVVTPRDEPLGLAHVEGAGRLTARMWAPRVARTREAKPVEARVAAALARRKALLAPAEGTPLTDAYRLVHGEADALPGLYVDRLGGMLRVLVTSPGTSAYRERAVDALVRALAPALGPDPPVVEVLHLRDRPPGALECVRLARGELDPAQRAGRRFPVHEGGATFLVDPGLGEPERSSPGVGLFLDQRENRARLSARERRRARQGRSGDRRGGRWLNLFAHTGAFSVALLRAGAREVTSVDLSGPYLAWLEENLAANGLPPERHVTVRQDARRTLETLAPDDRYDGILLDPPTAASAGRRFWSVGRELPRLVGRALSALVPGGLLFVSRNDRRRGALEALVREASEQSGVEVAGLEAAPPGKDFPRLAGFPEGDPFAAAIVTRAS